MRKFMIHEDGEIVELSPISYKEFIALEMWMGASDTAWTSWLYHNKYIDPSNYASDILEGAKLRFSWEPTPIDRFEFDINGNSDWKPYDPERRRPKQIWDKGCVVFYES